MAPHPLYPTRVQGLLGARATQIHKKTRNELEFRKYAKYEETCLSNITRYFSKEINNHYLNTVEKGSVVQMGLSSQPSPKPGRLKIIQMLPTRISKHRNGLV